MSCNYKNIMKEKFLTTFKEALEVNREITLDDIFRDYAEWDSLSHMSLIAMLDTEFNLQIENSAFERMKTVNDIFIYVQTHASQ